MQATNSAYLGPVRHSVGQVNSSQRQRMARLGAVWSTVAHRPVCVPKLRVESSSLFARL